MSDKVDGELPGAAVPVCAAVTGTVPVPRLAAAWAHPAHACRTVEFTGKLNFKFKFKL